MNPLMSRCFQTFEWYCTFSSTFLSFILPHRGFTKYLQKVDLFEACQIVGVWRRVVGEMPARKWECGGKVEGERLSKVMGRPKDLCWLAVEHQK